MGVGQLLRQPCMHDPVVGPTWQISFFFAVFLEICSRASDDLSSVLLPYNQILDRIEAFKLPNDAFNKPLLDASLFSLKDLQLIQSRVSM
jgi:hypothetical protein